MEFVFFVFYIALCIWIFPKISFLKNSNLTNIEIRILLCIKMLSGVLCAWYFKATFALGDHPSINEIGKIHYHQLLSEPKVFFTSLTTDIERYGLGGIFDSSYSFWAYLRFNLLFKFVAVLDLITKGNFYFNSVIFSSLVFFGHIAFFRIFHSIYKDYKWAIIGICFFLPSVWMYTSVIHKDGILYLSMAFVSFIFFAYLQNKENIRFRHILAFLFAIATIFLFRNYVIVALLPAMLLAAICRTFPNRKLAFFFLSYGVYGLIFFLSSYLTGSLNLPAAVVKRKADFALLEKGNTDIFMNTLTPDFSSFLRNLPQALNHTLFRPYLWEFSNPGILLTAIELLVYQLLVIAFIFFRKKQSTLVNYFNIFGFAFFINMMLIIGYTIPNIGAIVRYRSMFWIFLLCPLVCNIDWNRLRFLGKASNINS